MIILGHASIGTMTGIAIHQSLAPQLPLLALMAIAFVVGLATHYLTDAIPHGHYHINLGYPSTPAIRAMYLDSVGSVALMLLLVWLSVGLVPLWWAAAACIAGAVLPDVVEAMQTYRIIPRTRWLRAHTRFHTKTLHWHNIADRPRPWNLTDIWQVATAVVAVIFIVNLP